MGNRRDKRREMVLQKAPEAREGVAGGGFAFTGDHEAERPAIGEHRARPGRLHGNRPAESETGREGRRQQIVDVDLEPHRDNRLTVAAGVRRVAVADQLPQARGPTQLLAADAICRCRRQPQAPVHIAVLLCPGERQDLDEAAFPGWLGHPACRRATSQRK